MTPALPSDAGHILPALGGQPSPLPWYPDRLAWRAGVSRAALCGKDWEEQAAQGGGGRSEAVAALHAWLLSESELGRVQRQEAVSMVPPLLLDVRPGHRVLDMCASPGSKTLQLLEAIGGGGSGGGNGSGNDGDGDGNGGGLVVANDDQVKRCHMLASRAARLNSPNLVVINHDARLLPEWLGAGVGPGPGPGAGPPRPGPGAGAGPRPGPGPSEAGGRTPLRFDRVLADVPCSGDGTLRKNPLIWKRWTAAAANQLHATQLQIACKGVRLLTVGGRLAYSTCSMNPIENEAVVAAVLGGQVDNGTGIGLWPTAAHTHIHTHASPQKPSCLLRAAPWAGEGRPRRLDATERPRQRFAPARSRH